jgi:hypothetical protein
MKTHKYLVYRKGSNSMNQPCEFDWIPIAIVAANSREQAEQTSWHGEKPNINGCPSLASTVIVGIGNYDFWANQDAKAVPISRAPKTDIQAVKEGAFYSQ